MRDFLVKFVSVLILFYLLGAFSAASFDITKWDVVWRGSVALLGVIVAFAVNIEEE